MPKAKKQITFHTSDPLELQAYNFLKQQRHKQAKIVAMLIDNYLHRQENETTDPVEDFSEAQLDQIAIRVARVINEKMRNTNEPPLH